MRRCYKLNNVTYSVRKKFSKETVEISKTLCDQGKNLREDLKYGVIKYDKTFGVGLARITLHSE